MNDELRPDIRDLLARAREAEERPSAAERARVKASLMSAIGTGVATGLAAQGAQAVGTGVAGASGAAAPAATTGLGSALAAAGAHHTLTTLGLWVAGGAVLAGGVTATVWGVRSLAHSENVPVTSTAQAPVTTEDSPAAGATARRGSDGLPLRIQQSSRQRQGGFADASAPAAPAGIPPAAAATAERKTDPNVRQTPPRAATVGNASNSQPTAQPPTPRGGSPTPQLLRAEVEHLQRVQQALSQGQPDEALRLLDQSPPQGSALEPERLAARVFSHCAQGNRAAARRVAATLHRRFPDSVVTSRVRASCVGDARAERPHQ